MAVTMRPGLRPGVRNKPRSRSALSAAGALTVMLTICAAANAAMPRIGVRGERLYAGARPWRAFGMNWGIGDHSPVNAYFDDPTAQNFATLRTELSVARQMGANSMRIPLQLAQVMATPTRARPSTLIALQQLLALAQSDGIYLDITGDLVWQPTKAPQWYGRMPWHTRWQVQARFWKAVAHTAARSPAVLCYELTSEPVVAQTPGYYYGQIGDWWFVQSIATRPASDADATARAWTTRMAHAVRSQDNRPVTIGMLPLTTGPFAPANVGPYLDMITIHEYPATGQAASAISLIDSYDASHKPVLLGETFQLADDPATQQQFLTASAPHLTGAFEFFNGHTPVGMHPQTIADAMYQNSLNQFLTLRHQLLTS